MAQRRPRSHTRGHRHRSRSRTGLLWKPMWVYVAAAGNLPSECFGLSEISRDWNPCRTSPDVTCTSSGFGLGPGRKPQTCMTMEGADSGVWSAMVLAPGSVLRIHPDLRRPFLRSRSVLTIDHSWGGTTATDPSPCPEATPGQSGPRRGPTWLDSDFGFDLC